MPEPRKAKMTKRAANGSPLVYEYWRGSWTDAEKRRHSVNLGNVEVTTRAQARARLLAAIKADHKPTAEQVTVADWTQQHIDRMVRMYRFALDSFARTSDTSSMPSDDRSQACCESHAMDSFRASQKRCKKEGVKLPLTRVTTLSAYALADLTPKQILELHLRVPNTRKPVGRPPSVAASR